MSGEFISRILGMIVFAVLGFRFGAQNADLFETFPSDVTIFIIGLTGMLIGLIITPLITIRPVIRARRVLSEVSVNVLLIGVVGMTVGLVLALLAAYPLSFIGGTLGSILPPALLVVFGYLGMSIFAYRAKEITELVTGRDPRQFNTGNRELILDTSVLIDGRIVDIAQTGFLGGVLLVPRFVLSELHQVADSSDSLRRERGRRGLAMLNELQRDPTLATEIIEDDIPGIPQVDDKLVAVALARKCVVVTNDFNLNQVAEAQGVSVLNINELANAVRAMYIPGEEFSIHVLQEGRENGQGVGYLEDGTMVVIENGKRHMDRTINVEVTKLINSPAGRMIFASPSG
ncbi:MAG: PIN domain-containing protein [Chloroflexota bacterium]